MYCFLLTEIKDWLFLTFFPLEDEKEVERLRGKLRRKFPFLKAVTKALSYELERGFVEGDMQNSILDEIIRNIPPENSTSITISYPHTIDTLCLEFNDILNRFQLQLLQCIENSLGHFNMSIVSSKLLI